MRCSLSYCTTKEISMEKVVYMCYQRTVIVLSDHPRWIFRKNSIEFFVVLDLLLILFYSSCAI